MRFYVCVGLLMSLGTATQTKQLNALKFYRDWGRCYFHKTRFKHLCGIFVSALLLLFFSFYLFDSFRLTVKSIRQPPDLPFGGLCKLNLCMLIYYKNRTRLLHFLGITCYFCFTEHSPVFDKVFYSVFVSYTVLLNSEFQSFMHYLFPKATF